MRLIPFRQERTDGLAVVNDAGVATGLTEEFGGSNPITMAQQQEGDKPRRPFHRC